MDYDKVTRLQAKLSGMRPLSQAEQSRLQEEFVIEATYNSNAIEGNTLTLRETALILREGVTIAEKPIHEHLEAIGCRDAFRYILKYADLDEALSERIIKQIHSLVLTSDPMNRGVYRDVQVRIVGAAHTPPQPYLVAPQMESLLADYENMKRDKYVTEAVAEFHLRFEGIHPFIDGNGRVGRLIMNLELIKAGLLPVNIKFADRRKYYDCFDCRYEGSLSADALTELITAYEIEELERYIAILEGRTNGK